MSIPFTQFLRPNGRRTSVSIDRGEQVESMAARLVASGCRFEIEELRDGTVSIEALADNSEDPESPHCLAIELVRNGPAVPETVDKVIAAALKSAQLLKLVSTPEIA